MARRIVRALQMAMAGSSASDGASRHQEWIKFLNAIAPTPPVGLALDRRQYSTHKHPKVSKCSPAPSSTILHPTSSRGSNLIERWFPDLTDAAFPRRFQSVRTIQRHGLHRGHIGPKSIVWTAKVDDILPKVRRPERL